MWWIICFYDAAKRIVKLSPIVPLLTHLWSKRSFDVRRAQHLFISSQCLTYCYFSIIEPSMVKDSNQWKLVMSMGQNKLYCYRFALLTVALRKSSSLLPDDGYRNRTHVEMQRTISNLIYYWVVMHVLRLTLSTWGVVL